MSKGTRWVALGVILWAWAGSATAAAQLPEASGTCDITRHGARPNDDALDTAAVQSAIDACAAAGGGRVLVPPGRFVIGTIRLRCRLELHLSAGAILQGSARIDDYPVLADEPGDDHGAPRGRDAAPGSADISGVRALIVADGAEDVALTGTGTIDGRGPAFWGEGFMESGRARPDLPRPRPWIWLRRTARVTVRDILLKDSPSYGLTLDRCDDVFVSGLRIRNHPLSPNSDGIQVESSRNVRIVGVDIRTGDDAIVLKAGSGPVEHVLVTASYLESDDSAFKFGTGSRFPITHVRFSDSVIARSRIGIALFMKDGSEYGDFTASGIDISTSSRHATDYAVFVDVDRRTPDSPLGRIRDVTLRDLRIRTRGNLLIAGHPAAPLERVRLEGIDLEVAAAPVDLASLSGKPRGNALLSPLPDSADYSRTDAHVTIAHVRDLAIVDMSLRGATAAASGARHAAWFRDVAGLRVRGMRTDARSGGRAAFVTDGVSDVRFDGVEQRPGGGPLFLDVPARR
jgi:hypothetical protein